MEKLSGLVLDVYDDSGGAVLRELFSSPQGLPEITKEAHAITPEEYAVLPDDAFALVLIDGDVELKKFATIDEGNTALSVEYFLKTAHKLPEEAQKVAAQNLLVACQTFNIDAPEQLKTAGRFASEKALGVLPRYKQLLSGGRAKSLDLDFMGSQVPGGRWAEGTRLLRKAEKEKAKVKDTRAATGLVAAGAGSKALRGREESKTAGLKSLGKGKGLLDPSTFKDMAAKGVKAVGGKKPPRDPVTYQLMAKKMAEAANQMGLDLPKVGEHGVDRVREKTALSLQKVKANLDKAPDRPQKFKTHGDTPVKTASVAAKFKRGVDVLKGTSGKKARGRSLELLSEAEKRTPSMEAIRGGAKWSTPSSRRYGKASRSAGAIADKEESLTRAARVTTAAGAGGVAYGAATAKKKTAGLDKEALGAMGALMGALTLPEHARTAKSNLAATKGSGGMVMTPQQIQQRKAQMGMY